MTSTVKYPRTFSISLCDSRPVITMQELVEDFMKVHCLDLSYLVSLFGAAMLLTDQFHVEFVNFSEAGRYLLFFNSRNSPYRHDKLLEITVLDKRTNGPAPVTEHETKEPVTVKKEHPVLGRWHAHVQIEYCKPGESKHAEIESLEGFDPRVKHDREHVHRMLDEYLNVIEKRLIAIETNPDEIAYALDEHNEYSFKENGFQIFSSIDRHRQ